MKKLTAALLCAGLLSASMGTALAAVSADEAKKLGTELTEFGSEKAGNKDGTIPAYTGGLTTPPAFAVTSPATVPVPDRTAPLFTVAAPGTVPVVVSRRVPAFTTVVPE